MTVTLACSNPDGVIAFTTDGTDPLFGPGGEVLTGERFTAPLPLPYSATLSYRCRDQAGNEEASQRQTYTIYPTLQVELVGPPVISSDAAIDETRFRFESSLAGSYAIYVQGGCGEGSLYGGANATGVIEADAPIEISIEGRFLPVVDTLLPMTFCVTEPGGERERDPVRGRDRQHPSGAEDLAFLRRRLPAVRRLRLVP